MNPVRNFASGVRKERKDIMLQKQISNRVKKTAMKSMMLFSVLLIGCAETIPDTSTSDQSKPSNVSQISPQYYVIIANMADPVLFEKNILFIHPVIHSSKLIFTKTDTAGWRARYNIEIYLAHHDRRVNYISFDSETPAFVNYSDTQNPHSATGTIITYENKPGVYQLNLRITDKTANKSSPLSIPIIIRDVHLGDINISDPLFFTSIAAGKKFFSDFLNTTTANIEVMFLNPQTIDPRYPLNFAFELYINQLNLSLENKQAVITYSLLSDSGAESVFENKETFEIIPNTQRQTIGIGFKVPDEVKNGIYYLAVQVSIQDKNTQTIELNSPSISNEIRLYSPIPRSLENIDALVNDLQYIAPPPPYSVMKKLKKAKSKEKEKLYLDFWEKRGLNDMEQYHYRVAYADKYYPKSLTDDRRKVCIRFGPPIGHDVNKTTIFPSMRTGNFTYEIWNYSNFRAVDPIYFRPLTIYYDTKTFIFIDEYGFDHYTFGGRYGYSRLLEYHNNLEFMNY